MSFPRTPALTAIAQSVTGRIGRRHPVPTLRPFRIRALRLRSGALGDCWSSGARPSPLVEAWRSARASGCRSGFRSRVDDARHASRTGVSLAARSASPACIASATRCICSRSRWRDRIRPRGTDPSPAHNPHRYRMPHSLALQNRDGGRGTRATVRIPL